MEEESSSPVWEILDPSFAKRYEHTGSILASGSKIDAQFGKIQLGYIDPVTIADEALIAAPGTSWLHQFTVPSSNWPMPNKVFNANTNQWEKLYVISLWAFDGAGGFTAVDTQAIYVVEN